MGQDLKRGSEVEEAGGGSGTTRRVAQYRLVPDDTVQKGTKVACLPIYELCVEAEQMPGTSRIMRCWDQDVLNEPDE